MRLHALYGLGMLSVTALASAQPAESSMGQGEAAISVRSDLQMSIRGTGGTPSAHLDSLAKAIRGNLPALKTCYRERVQEEPSAEGAFRIQLQLEESGKPEVRTQAQQGSDEKLQDCVSRVFMRGDYVSVPRPAGAIVILQAENSRTTGQLRLKQVTERETGLQVDMDDRGRLRGTWEGASGQLRFEVAAAPGVTDEEAVLGPLSAVRRHFASFLDCHRRASVRGMSPVGQLQVELTPTTRGVRTQIQDSTVESGRAVPCVRRALGRLVDQKMDLPGPVWLNIYFLE